MEIVFIGLALLVGVAIGAFSHKWLASEVQSTTGFNPNVKIVSPFAEQASSVKPVAPTAPKV